MRVAKRGNSLAVRLPRSLVLKMNLKPGDELAMVRVEDRRLEVTKADDRNAALARMRTRRLELPADYRFDRSEANAR